MTWREVLGYLGLWTAAGCALFSAYVVVVLRTGIAFAARKDDGTLKSRIPLSRYASTQLLLLAIVGFQILANYVGITGQARSMAFLSLWALNLAHCVVLFLYDTVVIDWLVLARWRPGFLRLPEAMGGESMRRHILLSMPVGLLAGLALSALSTAVSLGSGM